MHSGFLACVWYIVNVQEMEVFIIRSLLTSGDICIIYLLTIKTTNISTGLQSFSFLPSILHLNFIFGFLLLHCQDLKYSVYKIIKIHVFQ